MKTALSATGEPIVAGDGMPETATCAHCKCSVTLRKRSLMGGGVTYFWRHSDNGRVPCRERARRFSQEQ